MINDTNLAVIEPIGSTEAGKAYYKHNRHPCEAPPSTMVGPTDFASGGNSVNMYCKTILPQLPPTESQFLFLKPPSATIGLFAATATSPSVGNNWVCLPSDSKGTRNPTFKIPGSPQMNEYQYLSKWRPSGLSSTLYLNNDTLYDKGVVTSAQFSPATQIVDQIGSFTNLINSISNAKQILELMGYTEESDLVKIKRKDNYVDFDRTECLTYTYKNGQYTLGGGPYFIPIQVVHLGKSFTNPGDVSILSPRSDSWPAKEGCFMVIRPNQPTVNYKRVLYGPAAPEIPTPSNNLLKCFYTYVSDLGNTILTPFYSGTTPQYGNITEDFEWADYTWGLVWFHGLSHNQQSELEVKDVFSIQVQPNSGSMLLTQAKPPPVPDNLAIEALAIFNATAPDALAARFNEGGYEEAAIENQSFMPTEANKQLAKKHNEEALENGLVANTIGKKQNTPSLSDRFKNMSIVNPPPKQLETSTQPTTGRQREVQKKRHRFTTTRQNSNIGRRARTNSRSYSTIRRKFHKNVRSLSRARSKSRDRVVVKKIYINKKSNNKRNRSRSHSRRR